MKTKLFERLVTKFSIKVNDLAKYLDISKATIYNYRNLDSFEEIPNDKRMKILYLFGKNTTEELELILDESDADILAKYVNRINSILNESINAKKESLVSIESLTSNVSALAEENAALKKQLVTLSKFGDLDEFTKNTILEKVADIVKDATIPEIHQFLEYLSIYEGYIKSFKKKIVKAGNNSIFIFIVLWAFRERHIIEKWIL